MPTIRPFHLAIAVNDLQQARLFYIEILGCSEGRSTTHWVDFDLFGHQLVCHLDKTKQTVERLCSAVDGDAVPVPHFGVILSMEDWRNLRDRLIATELEFVIEPRIRLQGKPGEQATMFFTDPAGNALEFKAFSEDSKIFEK
ncbi:MAG: VOC family protein [Proteobacteria bacterium]|nr:VOC family protein [Pseudomonadota bacterium]